MHREDNERYKLFSRRAAILGGLKFTLVGVLVGRMYQLQVLESDRYKMLADENRINMRLLPPPRGRILDRFGEVMAVNRENYRVLLVAEQTRGVGQTLDLLSQLIPIGDYERRRILREIKRRRSFVPVTVRENLDWREVSNIEVNAPDLPGVAIDVGQSREYPLGSRASHVLGYVAAVSEKEQTGDPLLELPGFRIGKSGIEKIYDLKLRGKAGNSQMEVNSVGRVMRPLSRREGQPGHDLSLTLDRGLQTFAVDRMGGETSAAAVVLDIHTGAILSLVSEPSFDPNAFNMGLSGAQWRAILHHPYAPLTNKAISGQYAPGSTFKMVVALAALENGIIGPEQTFFCRGFLSLGNARFHCWKKYGHGWMDMKNGIKNSCDVYFYEVARRVGIDRIAEMANRLGLGQKTGIDLPGEKRGLIPTRAWKQATIGVAWQKGETLISGIGQGFMLATPLQLAVMVARIANGGKAVTPHLVLATASGGKLEPVEVPPPPSLGISDASLRIVTGAMNAVTNEKRGTAYRARIKDKGMEMAGKTGTSQVRRITKRERETRILKNKERPWKDRDHALFVGFAPVHKPRYAAAVVVEHGGGGSKVAAPIVRDMLRETQRRDPTGDRPGGLAGSRDGENKA